MAWLRDSRFWVTVFIVGFWPAAILGQVAGVVILLAVVVGGASCVHWLDRRAL